jgi:hypothetical protein
MRRRSKGIETVVVTMATKREKHTRSMHRIFNKLTGRNNTVSQEQLKEDKELDALANEWAVKILDGILVLIVVAIIATGCLLLGR